MEIWWDILGFDPCPSKTETMPQGRCEKPQFYMWNSCSCSTWNLLPVRAKGHSWPNRDCLAVSTIPTISWWTSDLQPRNWKWVFKNGCIYTLQLWPLWLGKNMIPINQWRFQGVLPSLMVRWSPACLTMGDWTTEAPGRLVRSYEAPKMSSQKYPMKRYSYVYG